MSSSVLPGCHVLDLRLIQVADFFLSRDVKVRTQPLYKLQNHSNNSTHTAYLKHWHFSFSISVVISTCNHQRTQYLWPLLLFSGWKWTGLVSVTLLSRIRVNTNLDLFCHTHQSRRENQDHGKSESIYIGPSYCSLWWQCSLQLFAPWHYIRLIPRAPCMDGCYYVPISNVTEIEFTGSFSLYLY